MGRTKGVKNKDGHKAGGARKGSGRKPKSIEERSKRQMTGCSLSRSLHDLRSTYESLNTDSNLVADIPPATRSNPTTRDDAHAPTYEAIAFNDTLPERCPIVTCLPTSPLWARPSLPLPLPSKELYNVSPSNSWSADEYFETQSVHELDNPGTGSMVPLLSSYPPTNIPRPQLVGNHTSTDTPFNTSACSLTFDGAYHQSEAIWKVDGSPGSLNESNLGMPYHSPGPRGSPYSPYLWPPSSPMTWSSPSQESPASSYSSLESPVASAPLTLQPPKPPRRPRRCAVCLAYGEDLNALACPGRGDRNRCPLSRTYFDSNPSPHGDIAEYPHPQPGQTPILREALNIYAKYTDDSNVNIFSPFTISTIENTHRRPRHCKICTTTGRAGTTCPGRGNRALCPDFAN